MEKEEQIIKDAIKIIENQRKEIENLTNVLKVDKASLKFMTHSVKNLEAEAKAKDERTLSGKCFDLANELAIEGFGNEAVILHRVHNKLLDI